jgi:hypothetical protein
VASNLFLLLPSEAEDKVGNNKGPLDPESLGLWSLAKQIKLEVNLLPYNLRKRAGGGSYLADELKERNAACNLCRKEWKLQPMVKPMEKGPEGGIQPRMGFDDPLFSEETLAGDQIVKSILEAFDVQERFAAEFNARPENVEKQRRIGPVVAIIGPAGSGRLLKACQVVKATEGKYHSVVFHAYNNDDVYSYIKRIRTAAIAHIKLRAATRKREAFSKKRRANDAASRPLFLVINNIDMIVGAAGDTEWTPRNNAARDFMVRLLCLERQIQLQAEDGSVQVRILLTARDLPTQNPNVSNPVGDKAPPPITVKDCVYLIEVNPDGKQEFFSPSSVGLDKEDQFPQLSWAMQRDYSGLILAAAWIKDGGHPQTRV